MLKHYFLLQILIIFRRKICLIYFIKRSWQSSRRSAKSTFFPASEIIYSIYIKYTLLGLVLVCLFVSNKRQNDWTDLQDHILYGILQDPGKGMIKISKICLQQNSIVINFLKSTNLLICIFTLYTKRKCSRLK